MIYDLLDQEEPVEPKPLNYAQMIHHLVRIDPLCGGRMCFVKMEMGLKGHELVALRKATIRKNDDFVTGYKAQRNENVR